MGSEERPQFRTRIFLMVEMMAVVHVGLKMCALLYTEELYQYLDLACVETGAFLEENHWIRDGGHGKRSLAFNSTTEIHIRIV